MPGSLDDEARTVKVVWTTGAAVLRGYFNQYWEVLSLKPADVRMDRLNNSAPVLDAHDDDSCMDVIGVVQPGTASVDGKQGIAVLRFAKAEDDPEADQIYRKIKDGIVANLSVGYVVYTMEKTAGGAGEIPTFTATDWEPFEISVCPMGADDGAEFRSATKNTERTKCVFITRQEKKTMADETENPTPAPEAAPSAVATRAAAEADAAIAAANKSLRAARAQERIEREAERSLAAEEAVDAERARTSAIRRIARRHKLGETWATNLIDAGATEAQAQRAALDLLASQDDDFSPGDGGHIRIGAGDDVRDKFVRGATAWVIERSGHAETIQDAKKVKRLAHHLTDVATDPGEFRGMRLPDLARYALELRGHSTRGLHGEQLIRRALQTRGDQGFNNTSDFSILLENVVNKIFVGQYALAPVTWPMWAGRKSVQDFRTSTFYRPGTFGVLDSVTESGEIKHKNIPDAEKRTITPGTKGNIIGITRRSLANDDMGAFQNLASGLGLAAALTVESDAFALVTANSGLGISYDANPLFDASRNNIGPTGVMSVATLDGGRAKMARQKDPSANQFLALRPSVWLGPVELGSTAGQFNRSTTDPTDNKAQGVANKVMNMFNNIVDSPYLSAVSTTRHYLLADPNLYPVFAVGFIDGQEAPRIETEQSFGFDGVQMKVILDYGTAVIDFRGAVTCAGA
jgi:phage head maturation protease